LRASLRSRRGGRPPKVGPTVASVPSVLDKVRDKLFVTGKPKPCKYRGVIESCFGTFTRTWRTAARLTCDNPACKKRLRKDTQGPAVRRYQADPVNRATVINPRRRRNYPAAKGRINQLRRDATYANRQLKPCKITTIDVAKLPTAGLRATFAEARKTCLGEFYPKGKTQTCSDPCSDALAKLGGYKRQRKWDAKNKPKISTAKKKRRARNKARGMPPDAAQGRMDPEPRDIKCEYCGGILNITSPDKRRWRARN
jgi:hypothetical protein